MFPVIEKDSLTKERKGSKKMMRAKSARKFNLAEVAKHAREAQLASSMPSNGRRIRLKTIAEKVARNVMRFGDSAPPTPQSPARLIIPNLLSIEGVLDAFSTAREKNLLLELVRDLISKVSDDTLLELADEQDTHVHADPEMTPREMKQANLAAVLVKLDIQTLARIAGKIANDQCEAPPAGEGGAGGQEEKEGDKMKTGQGCSSSVGVGGSRKMQNEGGGEERGQEREMVEGREVRRELTCHDTHVQDAVCA